ncbi:XdhC family protein [Immundisolibacter sp.]|uniref:XdhC family protein n=1 Tax=Immundisolibacter sp. TaxID=1934948 RepID=UPI002602F63C|nr:XdhC family protein [Immundisolibacter sp.]MDD3650440.1 XdhC family protein [Immundisolibacter sp.]
MDSSDLGVIRALVDWVRAGGRAHLVTVVQTWGSSPRPAGSLLAVGGPGQLVGSVSGGCVEDDLIAKLRQGKVAATGPERVTYGVTREEGERFGLPCGGTLELVCEPICDPAVLEPVRAALAERRTICRELDLESGASRLLPADARTATCRVQGNVLRKVFGPQWQLIIIGAAELSRCIAQLAQALDYHVLVCDPRPDYAAAWDVPGTEIATGLPDDVIRARVTDERSAVITLTHDPRVDDLALIEALESPAFYVGALGSQRTTDKRLERLRELDVPEAAIARLHAPIGLPIGSHAPMEIAVAIAAELIAARNGALAKARASVLDTATRKAASAA